eukprot:CAMPEP_0183353488 /NCGR_PEP_ID=MMETSP0164_2-20130417/33281_1 /TAXON_ID=221442 /ORGANISM="Coccolithus pelagicus ssp braarudi, Strain PLY182g" /LENGTH=59 /DNA_ID=CAMNT_0025526163 /DNA_START=443 /DNA_END=619 /DNA_ORIENTATION=-
MLQTPLEMPSPQGPDSASETTLGLGVAAGDAITAGEMPAAMRPNAGAAGRTSNPPTSPT